MSIHSGNPFVEPPSERNPLRRLRARLPAPVTVWTTGGGVGRVGLTVSSILVADGDPGEVLGLIDGDSDFADALEVSTGGRMAISVLGQGEQAVADVFAGLAPSPGGMFRTGQWADTEWGPILVGAPAWLGVRLGPHHDEAGHDQAKHDHAGWARLVRARIERIEIAHPPSDPLVYLRGRYRVAAE